MIYLGQFANLDPIEENFQAENARSLVSQAFDNFTNASVQNFSPVSYSSDYDGGSLYSRLT